MCAGQGAVSGPPKIDPPDYLLQYLLLHVVPRNKYDFHRYYPEPSVAP